MQYFYRGGRLIGPQAGDIVIDGGGCLGDTAVLFALAVGVAGKVFSFDPLPAHQRAIRHNAAQNDLNTIEVIPMALGETSNNVQIESFGATMDASHMGNIVQFGFRCTEGPAQLPITTIDDFVQQRHVPKVDFIKMGIEASELSALKGAAKTIATYRPKLAISLYHQPDDFTAIPQFLSSLCPDYQFYLDHYTMHEEETVLFAIAKS